MKYSRERAFERSSAANNGSAAVFPTRKGQFPLITTDIQSTQTFPVPTTPAATDQEEDTTPSEQEG